VRAARKIPTLPRCGLLVAVVLVSVTASCNADLADGNPCRTLAEASCNWLARCHLFLLGSETASSCLSDAQEEKYSPGASLLAPPAACAVSPGDARSCASDLDSYNCPLGSPLLDAGTAAPSNGVPGSCQAVHFNPLLYRASPTNYTPSPTCGTLIANMENDSYVQTKASCVGGTTLPSTDWVMDDALPACDPVNGVVSQAIADCVVALCDGPLDPTSAASSDEAAVSAIGQACGAVPPGAECLFETQLLWQCAANPGSDAGGGSGGNDSGGADSGGSDSGGSDSAIDAVSDTDGGGD
jgi:uncharacterized membrane protein YgcG